MVVSLDSVTFLLANRYASRHVFHHHTDDMSGGFAAVRDQPEDPEDDRTLVRNAQTNSGAFSAVYVRYAHRIYLYVRSRVGTEEDATDITQQVFVKAFAAFPRYRISEAPLSAWLFRIARNAIVDFQRRSRSHIDLEAAPAILHDHGEGPEAAAMRTEERDRLRTAIAHLSMDKREILALRYAGGLRLREIAATMGTSEEAAKKRLSRALQALRKQYDETL